MATVVLPVWGPSPDLERCLGSVTSCTDLERNPLVVVGDGPLPPGPRGLVVRLVEERAGSVRFLERPERGGYPAAVNTGLREAGGDVVLLNSDTEVTEGWLEKLADAAHRRLRVASATPFSNNATLCSLPRPFAENALPAGHTVASFARLVEEGSAHLAPEIPTGVGFCLYVTREALESVGPLDEEAFGAGYGEEVDWCLRAAERGFAHVLDDATFVWHRGGGSFGPEGVARTREAGKVLARRYPAFMKRLARFMEEDPLGPVRARVLEKLRPRRRAAREAPPRVVHLVHGWPPYATGGTEVFARTIALAQADRMDVAAYARFSDPARQKGAPIELADHGVRVRLVLNDFRQRDPLSRNALHDRGFSVDFERFLDETRADLLHVHHLAGHASTLPEVARRRGLPVVFQLQDWWPLCARVNFLHAAGAVCAGPSPLKCAECRPLTSIPPARLTNPALHALRAALMRRALRADRFVAGSRFLGESWARAGWLPGSAVVDVVPYGAPSPGPGSPERSEPQALPIRFGFIGALMPHKGAHVAVGAFRGIPRSEAHLRIWGDPTADPTYVAALREAARGADVRLEGSFEEERKADVFAQIDVLVVPSVGLESYGIVVDEAMAHGVPVVASRAGALTERYGETCGAFFEPGDAAALRDVALKLVARPQTVSEWRRALPPARSMVDAARRIEEIYAELLPGRGAR